jgi:hypothetical protein
MRFYEHIDRNARNSRKYLLQRKHFATKAA